MWAHIVSSAWCVNIRPCCFCPDAGPPPDSKPPPKPDSTVVTPDKAAPTRDLVSGTDVTPTGDGPASKDGSITNDGATTVDSGNTADAALQGRLSADRGCELANSDPAAALWLLLLLFFRRRSPRNS